MSAHHKVICLTPIKNEAWILNRFIQCASLWADHIIIADQQSTDGSREIALAYPKVTLIDNLSQDFNEPERQKLLINEARKFSGPSILIALDADEFLTANVFSSMEWKTVLSANPGTAIRLQWINVLPDLKHCWNPKKDRVFGFVDDRQYEHVGKTIHSPRLPTTNGSPNLSLREVKVLHYQYTDWARMQSKHRWYQIWEKINFPQKSLISIYREYHHMYRTTTQGLLSIEDRWLKEYVNFGIDMTSLYVPDLYWWDIESSRLLEKYTPQYFSGLDIWGYPWSNKIAGSELTKDPRSGTEKLIHIWLRKSQFAFQQDLLQNNHILDFIIAKVIFMIDRVLKFSKLLK